MKQMTVKVPKSWGMFTSAGNRLLQRHAVELMGQAAKAASHTEVGLQRLVIRDGLERYFKKYQRAVQRDEGRKYPEANDTDVRGGVWQYGKDIGREFGLTTTALNDLWYDAEAAVML